MRFLDFIRLLGLSVSAMLLSATILGGTMFGLWGFVSGPFMMLFGWFYLPVVIALVFTAWLLLPYIIARRLPKSVFCAGGAIIASILFGLIGIKEIGKEMHFAIAYVLAAGGGALFACFLMWDFKQDGISKQK
jgi:hypothetical protein